jgi:hypothetical protein
MAIHAKRDEIIFIIISRVAAKSLMMDFEIRHGTAELASPPVAAKHAFSQFFVFTSCKSDRHLLL